MSIALAATLLGGVVLWGGALGLGLFFVAFYKHFSNFTHDKWYRRARRMLIGACALWALHGVLLAVHTFGA